MSGLHYVWKILAFRDTENLSKRIISLWRKMMALKKGVGHGHRKSQQEISFSVGLKEKGPPWGKFWPKTNIVTINMIVLFQLFPRKDTMLLASITLFHFDVISLQAL